MTRLPFTLFVYTCCFKALEKGQVIMLKRSFVLPSMNTLSCHINNPTRSKKRRTRKHSLHTFEQLQSSANEYFIFCFPYLEELTLSEPRTTGSSTWIQRFCVRDTTDCGQCEETGVESEMMYSTTSCRNFQNKNDHGKYPATFRTWTRASIVCLIFRYAVFF